MFPFLPLSQSAAVWQWWSFLKGQVPAGKTILRVNVDETSVCLFQGTAKGTVMATKRKYNETMASDCPREPAQKVSRSTRRTCLTHVAFVCDRSDIQPLLPQVVIGNEHTFQARDWTALVDRAPRNVYMVRQKSAWNNHELYARIITLLATVLAPYMGECQPVLLMDACRCHAHSDPMRACFGGGIWPVFVPAKLTWLLQPLDTHAFLTYKETLRAEYQKARAKTADGQLNVSEFLDALYVTIRSTLQSRCWAKAFECDGFGSGDVTALSSYVRRELAYEGPLGPLAVSAQFPTDEQFKVCFPKNAPKAVGYVAQPFARLFTHGPMPALPAPPLPALPIVPAGKGAPLVPRRPAPPPVPAASSKAGPVTRAQSRLVAALAKGRPVAPR